MQPSSSNFQNLRIIHIGLMAGPIFFLTICLTILKDRMLIENEIFYLVGLLIGIFASVVAFFVPSILSKSMKDQTNKDQSYQTLKIIQWAVIESSSLINLVFFFLTGKQESMIIAAVLIIIIASRFPSESEKDKLFPSNNLPYN
ncbi:MAG: hypothetical protein O9346_09435 [Leptospiraceae bacterium]|nr:hypothetical protein [Leptospiraceae bacterium]MCZ8346626.1 hypothetical protein [Leptospiraceae bacterium]